MEYPKRDQVSEDGKYYTFRDGRVFKSSINDCRDCDMADESCHNLCGPFCNSGWTLIEGAHVPSNEEQEAFDMARDAIRLCQYHLSLARGKEGQNVCGECIDFSNKSCPTRAYLASKGQQDTWEVK